MISLARTDWGADPMRNGRYRMKKLSKRPLAAAVAVGIAASVAAGPGVASADPVEPPRSANPQAPGSDTPAPQEPEPRTPNPQAPSPDAPVEPPRTPNPQTPNPQSPQTGPSGQGPSEPVDPQAPPQSGQPGEPGEQTPPAEQAPQQQGDDGKKKPEDKKGPRSDRQQGPRTKPQPAGPPYVVADIDVYGLPYVSGPTEQNPNVHVAWTDGVPALPPGPKLPQGPKLPKEITEALDKLPPPPVVVNIKKVKPRDGKGRPPAVAVTTNPLR